MKAALALLAAALTGAGPSGPAHLYYGSPARGRVVALTFDAGADRGFAASILTSLEQAHVTATFGMTGLWARANPSLVRRMARDGDAFINHTYDHRSFTGLSTASAPLSDAQRTWEVVHAARVIRAITHRPIGPYFRPPYGDYDSATLRLVGSLGYRYSVMWTVDSLGWDHLPAPAIIHRSLLLIRPGGILLMHVGSQSQDAQALPAVIRGLRQQGYRLVSIPRLISGH